MSSPGSASGSKRNSSELELEHAQRVPEAEPVQPQVKLKDRQKFFEEAFQQDMEHYLSTGYLQIAERRGSMSSMEVNVDMLEQMDLMDMSDHEALDVFLNSGGEDNSVASPMLGPDVESFTSEITLQVPTQADLRHKLASLSSTCTDSASQDTEAGEEEEEDEDDDDDEDDERGPAPTCDSLLVQPDQEEVEEDATIPEREQNQPIKNCESSSSS
ncbi:dystrobrevin binding protein 1b isoform X2 [Puntigrus tetrazona]|uniref:dystrobrevin binding protein 1b isoform X2 n=1 Tax=Puntigrus tetrazona TaxID=1606681 RepID=UPI001C894B03|nr:dystrobrevin binding protein 1b isoform X2 [Puntigrus tetrazona]